MLYLRAYVFICCASLIAVPSVVCKDEDVDDVTDVAALGEFPWLATFYGKTEDEDENGWRLICVGTLVNPRVVLTAASCVNSFKPSELLVKLGQLEKDFFHNGSSSVLAHIKRKVVPSGYGDAAKLYAMDIALVELTEDVPLSDNVKPVQVDWQSKVDLDNGHILSFPVWKTSIHSDVLHKTKLEYKKQNKCLDDMKPVQRKFVTSDKICALSVNGLYMVDKGNGGSGAVVRVDDRLYVIGLISNKRSLGDRTLYLLTNVTSMELRPWLHKNLDLDSAL